MGKEIDFAAIIKALMKSFFILFQDVKNEIAILKEKAVSLDSPKNVLHVQEGNSFHADYVTAIKEHIGIEKFYKTVRTGKNTYSVHPCLAGIIYHFCERIALKKALIAKTIKDNKRRDKETIKAIRCDLVNLSGFLCKDLIAMIAKDNPGMKLTARNALSNYLIVKDCEKGLIAFQTSGKK